MTAIVAPQPASRTRPRLNRSPRPRQAKIAAPAARSRRTRSAAQEMRGIDESNAEQIFKPFFKGKKQTIGNKGFGLGLAISKGLVNLLGGDLQFTSIPDKGTRFFFNISNEDVLMNKSVGGNQVKKTLKMKRVSLDPFENKIGQN